MKIAIAGGTGAIGSAVRKAAEAAGHTVTVLRVPRPDKPDAHHQGAWEKALEEWQPAQFSGFDALMFFGGESIMSRWTEKKRQRIRLSRDMPCRRMAECAAAADQPPGVIVTASAIGYYGERGEETLTEESAMGTGFLAEAAKDWEDAWAPAEAAGLRVVKLRLGVVLGPDSGALKKMLPAFKAGLGGKIGTGRQWMPWLTEEDAGRLALWCAEQPDVRGPVNAMAPEPVRQADFAKALGRALNRPAITPLPAAAVKLAFGEMGEATILVSCRAVPARAAAGGFHFLHDNIDSALQAIL